MRKYMVKLLMAFNLMVCLFAQDYTYSVPNFTDEGIKVNFMDFRYNVNEKTLSVIVETDNSAGVLGTGFYFVLSDGPLPTSSGEMAKIYFDASKPANPVVSIYGYNGNPVVTTGANKCALSNASYKYGSNPGKYVYPDRITSSLSSSSNQLQFIEKSAILKTVGSVTTATYYLKLDTTLINQHIPFFLAGTTTYKGSKFGQKIGLWGWVVGGVNSTYFTATDPRPVNETYNPNWVNKSTGYIKNLAITNCAMIDKVTDIINITTNNLPSCGSVTSDKLEVGSTGNVNIRLVDLENDSLKVEYESLPTSFVPAIPNGGSIKPTGQSANIGFVATPTSAQLGTVTFNVKVTQSYGGRFNITCPVSVSVDGIGVKCQETDITTKLIKMDSISAQLAYYNRLIAESAKLLTLDKATQTALNTLVVSSDKAHDDAWKNVWAISKIQTTCTGEKAGCTLKTQSPSISVYRNSISSLNTSAQKITTSSIALYKKVCTTKGKKAYVAKFKDKTKASNNIKKICANAMNVFGLNPKTVAKSPVTLIAQKVKEAETEVSTVPNTNICCGKC